MANFIYQVMPQIHPSSIKLYDFVIFYSQVAFH